MGVAFRYPLHGCGRLLTKSLAGHFVKRHRMPTNFPRAPNLKCRSHGIAMPLQYSITTFRQNCVLMEIRLRLSSSPLVFHLWHLWCAAGPNHREGWEASHDTFDLDFSIRRASTIPGHFQGTYHSKSSKPFIGQPQTKGCLRQGNKTWISLLVWRGIWHILVNSSDDERLDHFHHGSVLWEEENVAWPPTRSQMHPPNQCLVCPYEEFWWWMWVHFPYIILLYIPSGCTGAWQPCDVAIQRPLKQAIVMHQNEAHVQEVILKLQSGKEFSMLHLDETLLFKIRYLPRFYALSTSSLPKRTL